MAREGCLASNHFRWMAPKGPPSGVFSPSSLLPLKFMAVKFRAMVAFLIGDSFPDSGDTLAFLASQVGRRISRFRWPPAPGFVL